ncbi:DUF1080 domain-containing protein [Prevotella sp. 10(H)]|uniref:DUF1080 domain-containing protein n=1 Tax=Prevotella sp. 10(H) TaxID=1158294 RepID=UPI0004A7567C|nr:family 16 glycoside hydrolase [Prevotella sp. 10(H)]
MKKIYILSAVLMCCSLVYGQFPANRTAKTIVADVLAQMPAQQPQQYNNQMKDLASTGEEGVLQLVKMMNLQDGNAAVEYALSGLSHYVSAEGMEGQRLVTANAYIKALDMVSDREVKAFIIRQLEVMGKGEAVEKLSSFLDNESLGGPAAAALSAIDTPESRKALLYALNAATSDKTAQPVILAMAKLKMSEAENALILLADSPDANKRKVVLYALSQLGSKLSLPVLAEAAERDNYSMLKEGGNEAYIALIKRLLVQGEVKEAEKAANSLMKKAQKAGQTQTREAALEIMMKAKPESAGKLLQNALKDNNRNYRMAALILASEYADGKMYAEVIKNLKKQKPEVQTDIMNWLNIECENKEKRKMITPLVTPIAINMLTGSSFDIQTAAANLLAKDGSTQAVAAVAHLLNDANPQTVTMAKNALETVNGSIANAVIPVIATANSAGKIAGLELLAQRRYTEATAIVLKQLNADAPDVRTAAFKALKDVVSINDLDKLYSLLETAEPENTTLVQQAIARSIQSYPKEKQYETVLARMNQTAKAKQYLYYPVLGATGDAKALTIIVERFNTEEGAAKDAAFQALYNWKDIDAADKLLVICKNKSDILYFDRAINRYVQLVSNPELSGEKRASLLGNVLDIAHTDAQKKAILSQIGNTGSYPAMLRAGQYLDNEPLQQAAAHAVMNIALSNKQYTGKNVEELLNKVIEVLDNPDADYQRQAIRKHLNEMVIPEPFQLTAKEKAEGYKILFDGTNMDSWTGNTVDYIIENGCISLHPSNGHGGNLYTKDEYGNFIFRFEFQLTPAANNGLGIRTPMQGDAAYVGMELQILDNDAPVYSDLAIYQYHGSVYGIIPAKRGYLKPTGEWNYQEVIANGDNIKVILNGTVILDGNIRQATKNGTADKRNHPGLFNKKGHIAFLGHGSPVKFKNIRIKVLK